MLLNEGYFLACDDFFEADGDKVKEQEAQKNPSIYWCFSFIQNLAKIKFLECFRNIFPQTKAIPKGPTSRIRLAQKEAHLIARREDVQVETVVAGANHFRVHEERLAFILEFVGLVDAVPGSRRLRSLNMVLCKGISRGMHDVLA